MFFIFCSISRSHKKSVNCCFNKATRMECEFNNYVYCRCFALSRSSSVHAISSAITELNYLVPPPLHWKFQTLFRILAFLSPRFHCKALFITLPGSCTEFHIFPLKQCAWIGSNCCQPLISADKKINWSHVRWYFSWVPTFTFIALVNSLCHSKFSENF
jgi:hypothetical protein